jgi:hypothetical protein
MRTRQNSAGDDIFLVVSNAFNKYQNGLSIRNSGRKASFYASVYFVELHGQALVFYGNKTPERGTAAFETGGTLETGPYGVICYFAGRRKRSSAGDYVFALYDGEEQIFSQAVYPGVKTCMTQSCMRRTGKGIFYKALFGDFD